MIRAEDIQQLFGSQLARIENTSLRENVVKAWVIGCQRGGYENVDQLLAMPFTLLTDCRGVTFVEHTIAVTEGSIGLAKAQHEAYRSMPYVIDMDRLIAGALLHDVGKLVEIQQDGSGGFVKSRNGKCMRHPISGTVIAAEAGLPDEVLNIIACHAKEGEGRPQVVETVLIHLADFATFDPLVMKAKGSLIE
ncbi:MAG TPA: HD domain-containing protein [Polyangiaceae bacterium]|jgi:putative nucleotidyltransferase with HDIG domain|nr:MAG: HD domain protein [Deltaproteobacteria bacterium ADurb.Bin207]HNS99479.1 HD domain-containing protein [Polyangiaceae bacterium]HNZ24088.1 HD domain-containing protein [Polyangiaceae bacterium]HOD21879.1 HD domain-containing protein [Polyangiaceae bacterium]HOE50951.1 HD domain-containing protein [Polyangiaceae bacterium]